MNGETMPGRGVPAGGIEVIEPGALTTVQDLGRHGYQRYGVPVSGAMDSFALQVANLLVGNNENAAGLEATLAGPTLRFLADTVVAITGADLNPTIDGVTVPMWEAMPAGRGSVLSFRGARSGARASVAIAGGIDVPPVLGSRSTFLRSGFGGFEGRALRPGDRLPVPARQVRVDGRRMRPRTIPIYSHGGTLRVILGPQHDAFSREAIRTFLSSRYEISHQSDRMGYRLEGPRVAQKIGADIISDGTPAGAVQITGDGLPILLLADRGTAGGYTKIATVISADLPRLAQMMPGDRVRFRVVPEAEAHAALREQQAIVQSVRQSRPRVFRRRAMTVRTDAGEWRAITGFEEDPGSREWREWRERPIHVTIDGTTFVVEQTVLETMPDAPDTTAEADPGGSNRNARRAAAAVAAAVVLGSDPLPRDFPVVL
jgi:antagonist of KipI